MSVATRDRKTGILTSLTDFARSEFPTWDVPGIAVGLLVDGRVETVGLGVASLETGQPVTPGTLFQLASISKLFTATMVMMLVEVGRLDLDSPVVSYLPGLHLADDAAQRTLTLRHLLSHTSGLYGDFFHDTGPGDEALAQALPLFADVEQLTRPGELWAYANSGFILAGLVVETVLGTTFERVVRERLFDPLGLERSFYFAHEAIAYPVAVGHIERLDGQGYDVTRRYGVPRVSAPAGGLISTVQDLLRFADLHLSSGVAQGQRLLSEAATRAMQQPQTEAANFADAWGLGWDIRRLGDTNVIGHSGGSNGFDTRLTLVPSHNFAVAMLANGDGSTAINEIERWALSWRCGIAPNPPEIVILAAGDFERLTGVYRSQYDTIRVSRDWPGLRLDMTIRRLLTNEGREFSPPPLWVDPVSDLEFVMRANPFRIRVDFIPDASGSIRFLRLGGRLAHRVDS